MQSRISQRPTASEQMVRFLCMVGLGHDCTLYCSEPEPPAALLLPSSHFLCFRSQTCTQTATRSQNTRSFDPVEARDLCFSVTQGHPPVQRDLPKVTSCPKRMQAQSLHGMDGLLWPFVAATGVWNLPKPGEARPGSKGPGLSHQSTHGAVHCGSPHWSTHRNWATQVSLFEANIEASKLPGDLRDPG